MDGFSSISIGFWRTAEKLRYEAAQQTANQSWQVHWTVHSAICLYHAALECFINEEIALRIALTNDVPSSGYKVQAKTLCASKLSESISYCGLAGKDNQKVTRRVLLLTDLRNRLYHHWPEMRGAHDYPVQVIAALDDAKIEKVNTTWPAQCSDIRLAKWAAEVVREFVAQWWRIGRHPSAADLAQWEFGPDWIYPNQST